METILEITNLEVAFLQDEGMSYALCDVNLDLRKKEVLGIVGESGCGKTMTGLSILDLIPSPGRIVFGRVFFHQNNILNLCYKDKRALRGGKISIVFQEPAIAFNPLFTIGSQIEETIKTHKPKSNFKEETVVLLKRVGMPDPVEYMKRYPHELSGGLLQRAMIAMAISCQPEILIADEPTTALDVTIQSQILDLFAQLKNENQMSIILISHDLGVVSEISDRIVIMYAGHIVEIGNKEDIVTSPKHPYSKGLLGASLSIKKVKGERLSSIPGNVPLFRMMPEGCPFFTRCSMADVRCESNKPCPVKCGDDWWVWCWRV